MNKILSITLIIVVGIINFSCQNNTPNLIQDLKCEYVVNPIGIENSSPRLSWIYTSPEGGSRQSAYQILAASDPNILNKAQGDLWDTGKIPNDQSIQISYSGKKLKSRQIVYWQVRIWDQNDQITEWSDIASWEMGFIEKDDWKAQWIGAPGETDSSESSPLFREEFVIQKQLYKARAYISGLGYYELFINGKKVGDHVLSPNQTNYSHRRVEKWTESRIGHMSTRVLYEIYDVTQFIREGENAIGVWLGGGWFIQNDRLYEPWLLYDTPRFSTQIELEFTDGSRQIIISDDSWKTHPSPILHNGLHTGEIYDARLEIPDWNLPGVNEQDWKNAVHVRSPDGPLHAQISPPDRVIKNISPTSFSILEDGIYRYDLGQMISGWTRLSINGPKGTSVKMKFIEELGPSYSQTDTYILKGEGTEIWEPRFTWHAFRYIDVTCSDIKLTIDNLEGRVVNTDVKHSGSFKSSNQLFNQIFENYQWTQLGNMHGGIPSDCPHRERRGYTGDGQIAAKAAIYAFDMAQFYTKWLNDIADAQNQVTGYVPNTAPYQDGGGGTAWGSAYVIIPWYMYLYYGDQAILETHYKGMQKWLFYLNGQLDKKGRLVNQGLGEWVPPDINKLPPDFVNTCYYYYNCILVSKIAGILEEKADHTLYLSWAEKAKNAINNNYFNDHQNNYSIGRQGANVFPLGFGITQNKLVLENLVNQINLDCQGHFNTGILGTPLLLDVLTTNDHAGLAYTLMNQRDFPGFGYMIEKGATTIWETWQGDQSHSHPMFGSVCQWFYQILGGINPDENQPGFKHINIKPFPIDGLSFVNTSYQSPYGRIQSNWEIVDDDFYLNLTIPSNTTATVHIPGKSPAQISENRKTISTNSDISFGKLENGYASYNIGPGKYRFISKGISSLRPIPNLSAPRIFPNDTLIHKPDSLKVTILSEHEGAEIFYSMDGSEPTQESIKYKQPLFVKDNSIIHSRIYKKNRQPGYIKKRIIHFVDPKLNGLNWRYYEGEWMWLPDFEKLEVKRSGSVFQFGLDNIRFDNDEFGLVFNGFIHIDKPGKYHFFTLSNDGSCLYLKNRLVVNNDGGHGPVEKTGAIFLKNGTYPIRVTYFQAGGGMFLKVSYEGPEITKQEIPANILFKNDL